jgi:hypothetical protein
VSVSCESYTTWKDRLRKTTSASAGLSSPTLESHYDGNDITLTTWYVLIIFSPKTLLVRYIALYERKEKGVKTSETSVLSSFSDSTLSLATPNHLAGTNFFSSLSSI